LEALSRAPSPVMFAKSKGNPPSENRTSKLGRNIYKGGRHETVHIGNSGWEPDHWHGGRGRELVRLKRQREGAEREPAAIRLLPPTAAADRHWTHEEANGAAGTRPQARQESLLKSSEPD